MTVEMSNADLYDKMIDWGWTPTTPDPRSEYREMNHVSGQKMMVYAPFVNAPAGEKTIAAVVRITTAGNELRFWEGPHPTEAANLSDESDDEENVMLCGCDCHALGNPPTVHCGKCRADDDTTQLSADGKRRGPLYGKVNGNGDRIFAFLVQHPRAEVHVRRMASELDITVNAASNACSWMVQRGRIRRVKRGVYSYVHPVTPAPPGVTLDLTAISQGAPPVPVRSVFDVPFDKIEVVPPEAPWIAADLPPAVEDDDGTIDTILGIMFPRGFKAKDLDAIRTWSEATRSLIRSVNSS